MKNTQMKLAIISKNIIANENFNSILEAGIGEGTTFLSIIKKCVLQQLNKYGFDISWSRSIYADLFLKKESKIFTANMFEIPISENSMDLVYTSHSLEPNRGSEEIIIKELYRITKKYLFLFEPDYSLASQEGKDRMNYHGYVKDIYKIVKKLGYDILEYAPIKNTINKLNPTSVIIIKKEKSEINNLEKFQCPVTKTPLIDFAEVYFSPSAYIMYPVIKNIPYLISSHAILGTKYNTNIEELLRQYNTKT